MPVGLELVFGHFSSYLHGSALKLVGSMKVLFVEKKMGVLYHLQTCRGFHVEPYPYIQ